MPQTAVALEWNKLIVFTLYFSWSFSILSQTTAGHARTRTKKTEKLWIITGSGHILKHNIPRSPLRRAWHLLANSFWHLLDNWVNLTAAAQLLQFLIEHLTSLIYDQWRQLYQFLCRYECLQVINDVAAWELLSLSVTHVIRVRISWHCT